MQFAIAVPAAVPALADQRPERCQRCGSPGFNLHQRATTTLKDPLALRAPVLRFICKRRRKTTRLYPKGVDGAHQTVAMRQASVVLYWLGLSYDGVREYLGRFGCPLSKATVWANVRWTGLVGHRHRLRSDSGSLLVQEGPGGPVARLRVRGRSYSLALEPSAASELTILAMAHQPETARILYRRVVEVARRLRLQVEPAGAHENARA